MKDNDYVVRTEGLSFSYGNQQVLNDVSLRVPSGSIYGFLGRNGAGKTTTLKICLGLLREFSGTVTVFGKTMLSDRNGILDKTGALIESPSLYDNLTGWDNIRLTAILRDLPESRMREALEMVGMSNQASKRVGAYSHGMKQRLGIALALLPDPELLILDEPTNGLDPNGIQEMRALIGRLNQEFGKTILLSSHILSEIEKTCDQIGIIESGTLIFQDSLSSFKKIGTGKVLIRVSNAPQAARMLSSAEFQTFVTEDDNTVAFDFLHDSDTSLRIKMLVENGIDVYEVTSKNVDLETFFLEKIRGGALV